MSAAWYLEQLDSAVSWQTGLDIGVANHAGRTVIDRLAHRGPLRVQRAFHPEGPQCPHVYVLHPPGGLVSGDTQRLNTDVGNRALVLLTTPSSGKCYRARDDGTLQQQLNRFQVAAGGSLEYLPQDTIAYQGCNARLTTRVDLQGDARLCLWDLLCLGRPAAAEGFDSGRVDQHLDVWRDGRPLYIERNRFDGGDQLLSARWGLGGCSVSGTWLATLSLERTELDALREDCADIPQLALTQRHGLLIGRYLGDCAEHARLTFMRLWQQLRPRINGRPACAPRIWNT